MLYIQVCFSRSNCVHECAHESVCAWVCAEWCACVQVSACSCVPVLLQLHTIQVYQGTCKRFCVEQSRQGNPESNWKMSSLWFQQACRSSDWPPEYLFVARDNRLLYQHIVSGEQKICIDLLAYNQSYTLNILNLLSVWILLHGMSTCM